MKIGIFSEPHNQQATALCQAINELAPGSGRHFSLPNRGVPPVAVAEEGVFWDGVNVADFDLAYIHGWDYSNPILPRVLGSVDWSLWQADYLTDQQQASFLYSVFSELERRGVRLFNPPATQVRNFLKVDLLERLREAGLDVPRMLCTNDMEETKTFVARLRPRPTAWRPVTGRAAWQLFLDHQREVLISPRKPPILLAEGINGLLIRAYVLNGQPLLCLKRNAAVNTWNAEALEVFQAVECPEVVSEALARAAEAISLRWGVILFVLEEERAWFYDVDADPLFDELPAVFRKRLTEGLARGFLDQTLDALPALPDTPQPRPTLFLRRMLHLLFEFERQKYQPPQ